MNSDLKLVNGGGGPQPLPVFETLKMSFSFIGSNVIPILRISIIPILIIIVTFELFGFFDGAEAPASGGLTLLSSLVSGAAIAIVVAAIGRMVLFNDVPQSFGLPAFGRQEMQTWMASILSSVLTALAGAIPGALVYAMTGNPLLAVAVALVPIVYVAILLALIYPIVLTSGRLDFRRCVMLGKGSWSRLLAIIFLASLATFVAAFVILSLFFGVVTIFLGEEGLTDIAAAATAMFMVAIQVLMAAVNIVVVSFAFRWIDYYSPDPLLRDQQ